MPNVVILQRVVPPYRMPLYERLWQEFGWTVAYGSNLSAEGMRMEREAPFLRGYNFSRWPFNFTSVPLSTIIDDLKPDQVKFRKPGQKGSSDTIFFKAASETPDAPHAFLVEYDPGRLSNAHYHPLDQFQILVKGHKNIEFRLR